MTPEVIHRYDILSYRFYVCIYLFSVLIFLYPTFPELSFIANYLVIRYLSGFCVPLVHVFPQFSHIILITVQFLKTWNLLYLIAIYFQIVLVFHVYLYRNHE